MANLAGRATSRVIAGKAFSELLPCLWTVIGLAGAVVLGLISEQLSAEGDRVFSDGVCKEPVVPYPHETIRYYVQKKATEELTAFQS